MEYFQDNMLFYGSFLGLVVLGMICVYFVTTDHTRRH